MSYKISYAVDAVSSEDEDVQERPPSETKAGAVKKRVAASKSSNPTKRKASTRTSVTRSQIVDDQTTSALAQNGGRKPLQEISNASADVAHQDDEDELDQSQNNVAGFHTGPTMNAAATSNGVTKTKKPKAKTSKSRAKAKQELHEVPETQEDEPHAAELVSSKTSRKPGQKIDKSTTIPETQLDAMDVDQSTVSAAQYDAPDQHDHQEKRTAVIRKTSEPPSKRQQTARKRAGSTSETERPGNDPKIRRKLGEMTKKFEAIELKYHELRDAATVEADSNFAKLKQQADENAQAANDLIASLRAELAAQKAVTAEVSSLKAQVETLTTKNQSLSSEKKTLAASLTEAQTESKTLHAKLAATRSASNPAEGNEKPNSKNGSSKMLIVSNAEAAKEAQKRMLKEDLYSDLTGLIVLDVKHREEENEDTYDCIQTGRNGTLHFHLTVANPAASRSKSNGNQASYENAEFQYTPLLDENRDKDLMEILPDYLTEEICFPRNNAAKFYSRVVDCLTKKVELVDNE